MPHHIMEASFITSWSWKGLIPVLVVMVLFVAEAKADPEFSEFNVKSSGLGKYNTSKLSEVLKLLRKINKPAIKTIQSPDGDLIDCIDRHKQPAFDHPLLKNHKIQDPPELPSMPGASVNTSSFSIDNAQEWHVNGNCPEGTVPVRRTTVEDLMRAKSPQDYGRKFSRFVQPDAFNEFGHEHAIAYVEGEEYYGAKATIGTWGPRVEKNEFSLSQIWVYSGTIGNSDVNTVEAGWHVNPPMYGDTKPRLFTYWTADGYGTTGCYNLKCSGFVQYSQKIAVSAPIWPLSKFSGKQYSITLLLWKDTNQTNWWLAFGNELVGYWPAELFTNLDHASTLQWGGEIINTETGGQHTSTEMGSGHFAELGYRKANIFHNIQTVDGKNVYKDVQNLRTFAKTPNCYNIQNFKGSDWGTYFFYGGPGRNPKCP